MGKNLVKTIYPQLQDFSPLREFYKTGELGQLILSFLTKKWKNKTRRKNDQSGTQLPRYKIYLTW